MKIRKPADEVSPRLPVPAYDLARVAAIEKQKSAYIHLECGHVTTWEDDLVYSFQRPHRDKSFCEKCGNWRLRLRKRKPADVPDTPLF